MSDSQTELRAIRNELIAFKDAFSDVRVKLAEEFGAFKQKVDSMEKSLTAIETRIDKAIAHTKNGYQQGDKSLEEMFNDQLKKRDQEIATLKKRIADMEAAPNVLVEAKTAEIQARTTEVVERTALWKKITAVVVALGSAIAAFFAGGGGK